MHEHLTSHSLFRARAHAAHSEQLEALSKLIEKKGTARGSKALQALETALLAHLRAEEELILPDFGLQHAAEAAHIRAQHDQIRRLLVRVDGAQGDEALAAAALAQLAKLVRDCVVFVERQLYPWAERQLRASKKGEFLQRMQRHSLVGPSFHWQT